MSPRAHVGSSPAEKGVYNSSVGSKGGEFWHCLELWGTPGGKGVHAWEKAQGCNL